LQNKHFAAFHREQRYLTRSLSALFALVAVCAFGQQIAPITAHPSAGSSTVSPGAFDKIWSVAASQFNQSDQWAGSLTQLTNGTLVAAGGDGGTQPNSCRGFFGGAWLIAVTPGGGNVFQKLYSDCATAEQWVTFVRSTTDGGFILSGEDNSTAFCQPCAWLAKFGSSGTVVWQEDLTSFVGSGVNPKLASDGGYVAAGFGQPKLTGPISGLILKFSASGAAQWSELFTETAQSFPGAVVNNSGGLNFNSIVPTPDGGYVLSGVADAKFSSGFAHVLVVMKISSVGNVQWARAYYSSTWGSYVPGESLQYPVFPTPDGGYVVSGTVQTLVSPFETMFFLMGVDSQGNVLWQKGYGGVNGSYLRSNAISASATSDGGYILAGYSNIFLQEFDGWLVKTDAQGNIEWQNVYSGTEQTGFNSVVLNDIIQTTDGGYSAAGSSYVGSLSYGGPGFFVLKTDAQGNVGTCTSCSQATDTSVQPLDLQAHDAAFDKAKPALIFAPTSMQAKKTSVTPISLFP
jgi:hypothetical protein